MEPIVHVQSPKSKIEIRIKCKDLPSKDLLSKSDPQTIVYIKKDGKWKSIGKTEKIKNDNSPHFKQPIIIDYTFQEIQYLKFVVIDIDKDISDYDSNDLIGEKNLSLGEILACPGGAIKTTLFKNGNIPSGTITVSTEQIYESKHNIILKLEGHHLDKKDAIGSSDPYFKITKSGGTMVYKSDVIKNTLDPIFPPVYLKLEDLNGGDMLRELTFEVFDWDRVGEHDLIGRFTTNTDTILSNPGKEYELINPKKIGKSSYKNSGVIKFFETRLMGEPTFLDYLNGGCELNLMIAIDCTGSNGTPSSETSLHYNTPEKPSQYAQSIATVGSVLAPYDFDQVIEVVGFGGQVNGHTSMCFGFDLKGDDSCKVHGLQSVLDIYHKNINRIDLSGPTNFGSVLEYAIKKSSKHCDQGDQKYVILMIITDGDISDTQETIDHLVKGAKSPLSVVIVGVGNHNFDTMNVLDGDDHGLVNSKGEHTKRDITQFIPFRKYQNDLNALAYETLKEIPSQLLSYFKMAKIFPNPPRAFNC